MESPWILHSVVGSGPRTTDHRRGSRDRLWSLGPSGIVRETKESAAKIFRYLVWKLVVARFRESLYSPHARVRNPPDPSTCILRGHTGWNSSTLSCTRRPAAQQQAAAGGGSRQCSLCILHTRQTGSVAKINREENSTLIFELEMLFVALANHSILRRNIGKCGSSDKAPKAINFLGQVWQRYTNTPTTLPASKQASK